MRRLWIPILILDLLLTGCWSKAELNEVLFIDGLYLDKGQQEGQIQLSLSTFITAKLKGGGEGGGTAGSSGKPITVITKSGDNIPDILTNIQKDLTRRINFSHLQVVLVSEDYARLGLGELFDWFKREPALELNTFILSVAGRAHDIAQLNPITEQLPADVFKRFAVQDYMLNSTVKQCLISADSGMGYAMTSLTYGDQEVASENGETVRWASIKGVDVFMNNALTGQLDINQGLAISWAFGKLKDRVYTVNWDGGQSKGSVLLTRNSSRITYLGNQEGPLFKIHLKGRGNLVYKKDIQQRTEIESNKKIKEALENKVKRDMEEALAKTQQWGTDVLNVGMLMEWNNPKEWKPVKDRWSEVYRSQARFQVEVDIGITNVGSTR